MRRVLPASAWLLSIPLNAQFIQNPDFDDPGCWPAIEAWSDYGCWYVVAETHDCNAMLFEEFADWNACSVFSPILGAQPDVPYELTFWVKKTSDMTSGIVYVVAYDPGVLPGTGVEPSMGALIPLDLLAGSSWVQLSIPFTLSDPFAGDNLYVQINLNNLGGVFPGITCFDDFAVNDLSTGLAEEAKSGLKATPNPATDRLWADLPDVPLSITAIDASGRAHDLKNFTHRDRTLEVDVNALPTGICLLRITTASGTHAVRFVKA